MRKQSELLLLLLPLAACAACLPQRHDDASVAVMETTETAPPEGATARCRDGHYSFALERRAACSQHGGVTEWLREI